MIKNREKYSEMLIIFRERTRPHTAVLSALVEHSTKLIHLFCGKKGSQKWL
jgi:hypothetical protein